MRTRSTTAPAAPVTPVKGLLRKGSAAGSSAGKAPAAKKQKGGHTLSPFFVKKEETPITSPYFDSSIQSALGDAAGTWHDLCLVPDEFRLQVTLMSGTWHGFIIFTLSLPHASCIHTHVYSTRVIFVPSWHCLLTRARNRVTSRHALSVGRAKG